MKTNVAVVHHSMKRGGGSEKVVYDLLSRMDRDRFQPSLICMYGLGEFGKQLKSEGVRTYERVIGKAYDPRNAFRIAAILKQEQVDVLYVTDGFHNMVLGQLAASIARTPQTVLGFHSYDTVIRQSAPKLRRMLFEFCDFVFHPWFEHYIALAESHKEYLATVKRLPREKIGVVYNGVDLERFQPEIFVDEARRRFDIPTNRPVVGIVAGLRKWKAHDMFLQAAACVRRQVPDAFFVLAGDGSQRAKLEQMADDLGLRDAVRFLGVVEDIPTLLYAVDVSTLSSIHEAFPLTLLEAMAARRPVVSTDAGSVADIIDDGVNGYLVPVGAVDQFADSIVGLLQHRKLAKQFGQAGREKVESLFTVDLMVRRTEALFHEWTHAERAKGSRDFINA